jgi:hypothetical protein
MSYESGCSAAARSGRALHKILDTINIHQITEVLQEIAKGDQDSLSGGQLSGLAEDIHRLVGQFKLTA